MGGAPANVACHLQRHGVSVHLLSAVGRDFLGDEILRRLELENVALSGVARHASLPTGYVRALIGKSGNASYEIVRGVAWDRIPLAPASRRALRRARALVFGSLAHRSAANRAMLDRALALLPDSAWRIFDVNLRPPFDDLALVRQLAPRATLIKLNDEEAARLAGERPRHGREERHARQLAAESGCAFVCVTAGKHGAGLLAQGAWHWAVGRRVTVADTVGAGDSFLASLVASLLRGDAPGPAVIARACRLGEWVASRRGATPPYDASTPTGLGRRS